MKTKQTQIIEAIRAVCPETMKLKEGCIISVEKPSKLEAYVGGFKKQENTGNTDFYSNWKMVGTENSSRGEIYRYEFVTGYNGYSNTVVHISVSKKDFELMNSLGKIEILGTPLDLSHLLRAIPHSSIDCDGYITVIGFPNDLHANYNLTKTLAKNLEDPALCEFLYRIIVEK